MILEFAHVNEVAVGNVYCGGNFGAIKLRYASVHAAEPKALLTLPISAAMMAINTVEQVPIPKSAGNAVFMSVCDAAAPKTPKKIGASRATEMAPIAIPTITLTNHKIKPKTNA